MMEMDPPEPHPSSLTELFPYASLQEYALFKGELSDLEIDEKVAVPYELNTPLFSDYSSKQRFIYLPPGEKMEFKNDEVFDFPLGAIIVKTFFFWNDLNNESAGRRILETRLLVNESDGWKVYSYLWNDEQTMAEFKVTGKQVPVSWIHTDGEERNTLYLIPNQNECKNCHSQDVLIEPIGPKGRNLNKAFAYESGTQNQLEKMVDMDFLETGYTTGEVFPKWDDPQENLNKRARAYLDVNCAHCHNPEAAANSTGLYLNYLNEDPNRLGVCKPPVAAGNGSGGLQYSIVPGSSEVSIMPFRMNSTQLDVMMPELARSIIHDEGVKLIQDWIDSMEEMECGG